MTMALIMMTMAVTVSAENHVHTWDLVDTKEEARVHITCTTCDQYVILPTDNLLCEHDFVFTEYDHYHGNQCVDCGYSVLEPHTLIEIGFVDGFHLIECTDCDIQIYHSVTEWVDEAGHHHKCDVCGKVETYIPHTPENMWAYDLNQFFHAWECWECGYLVCETHTPGICTVCGYCTHPSLIVKGNEAECDVECPDCGHSYTGDHDYYLNDSDVAVCETCGIFQPVVVQYGILLENTKLEEVGYTIKLLVDGNIHTYKGWNTKAAEGSLVRLRTAYDQAISLGHRADVEVVNNLDNMNAYLHSTLLSKYKELETLDSITVSSVSNFSSAEKEELYVEFNDGGVEFFNPEELVVYNLTTGSMDEVEENDVILYFSPREEGQKEIIIIIG